MFIVEGRPVAEVLIGRYVVNGGLHIERMLKIMASKGGMIDICETCMDASGMKPESASSHAVERLDVKGADFCKACRKTVVEDGYW